MSSATACVPFTGTKTFPLFELKTEGDPGTFSGYASAYTKDVYDDRITPGAFGKTIAAQKGKVPLLMNHNPDKLLGATTGLAEDGKGLLMNGRLATDTTLGADAYGLLKLFSAIDYRMGMSIGFTASEWNFDETSGVRTLDQIDLWEISLTPFPAQPKAYVTDVKTLRDLEGSLRDAGLSQLHAKRAISVFMELNPSANGTLADTYPMKLALSQLAQPLWRK
jgi:HK97 family phage prohead protease